MVHVHVHCPVEHNNVRDDAQCIMIKDIIQMCEGCNRVVLEIYAKVRIFRVFLETFQYIIKVYKN